MILIVDDDNAVRMSVSLALNRAGFEPWAVAGEEDALAAARDERVELVILDMNLTLSTTGRQGIEMLRKIRVSGFFRWVGKVSEYSVIFAK